MTTTNTNPRIYPGLICSGIEFFNHEDGLKVFTKGKLVDFQDLPYTYLQIVKDELNKLPEAKAVLEEWIPNSELQQLEKFASCRFGGLDYTPDIKNFQLQPGEHWDCPLRGSCKGEGKVCKPVQFNNHTLESKEINLLKLLTTNNTMLIMNLESKISLLRSRIRQIRHSDLFTDAEKYALIKSNNAQLKNYQNEQTRICLESAKQAVQDAVAMSSKSNTPPNTTVV